MFRSAFLVVVVVCSSSDGVSRLVSRLLLLLMAKQSDDYKPNVVFTRQFDSWSLMGFGQVQYPFLRTATTSRRSFNNPIGRDEEDGTN